MNSPLAIVLLRPDVKIAFIEEQPDQPQLQRLRIHGLRMDITIRQGDRFEVCLENATPRHRAWCELLADGTLSIGGGPLNITARMLMEILCLGQHPARKNLHLLYGMPHTPAAKLSITVPVCPISIRGFSKTAHIGNIHGPIELEVRKGGFAHLGDTGDAILIAAGANSGITAESVFGTLTGAALRGGQIRILRGHASICSMTAANNGVFHFHGSIGYASQMLVAGGGSIYANQPRDGFDLYFREPGGSIISPAQP